MRNISPKKSRKIMWIMQAAGFSLCLLAALTAPVISISGFKHIDIVIIIIAAIGLATALTGFVLGRLTLRCPYCKVWLGKR